MSRHLSLANFCVEALEEVSEASLNAGQDITELGPEIHEAGNFIDSEIIQSEQDVAALEERIVDLIELINLTNTRQGMSKDIALEAERILPGFIKGNIEYYTDAPSKTQLSVSLEEMSNTVKTFLVALVAAALALIYKLVKWLIGGSSSSSSGGSYSNSSSGVNATATPQDFNKAKAAMESKIDALDKQEKVVETISHEAVLFDDFLKGEPVKVYPDLDFKKYLKDDDTLDESKRDEISWLKIPLHISQLISSRLDTD